MKNLHDIYKSLINKIQEEANTGFIDLGDGYYYSENNNEIYKIRRDGDRLEIIGIRPKELVHEYRI